MENVDGYPHCVNIIRVYLEFRAGICLRKALAIDFLL
jgi:hypothetical protein